MKTRLNLARRKRAAQFAFYGTCTVSHLLVNRHRSSIRYPEGLPTTQIWRSADAFLLNGQVSQFNFENNLVQRGYCNLVILAVVGSDFFHTPSDGPKPSFSTCSLDATQVLKSCWEIIPPSAQLALLELAPARPALAVRGSLKRQSRQS